MILRKSPRLYSTEKKRWEIREKRQEKLEAWSRRPNTKTIRVPERINSEHKREETIIEVIQENFPELESMSFQTESVQNKELK